MEWIWVITHARHAQSPKSTPGASPWDLMHANTASADARDAGQVTALPVDRAVASAFATLVVEMRAAGHGRLGVQDAWIAATAIAHDADLLTQDADFDAVPSLRVIKL